MKKIEERMVRALECRQVFFELNTAVRFRQGKGYVDLYGNTIAEIDFSRRMISLHKYMGAPAAAASRMNAILSALTAIDFCGEPFVPYKVVIRCGIMLLFNPVESDWVVTLY